MIERLAIIPREILALVMATILVCLLLLGWKYFLEGSYGRYKELAGVRDRIEELVANGETVSEKIHQYRREITVLNQKLRGEQPLLSSEEITAHVIGHLDRISREHNVTLAGVTPGNINKVLMFEEVPFDIEVAGKYADLYSWLYEVTAQLGPMVISQFRISYNPGAPLLNMDVKLASYKSLEN